MAQKITIVVVEEDRDRAHALVDGLSQTGDADIIVISGSNDLAGRIRDVGPDVVLVGVADPSRDRLEELALAAGARERTVAMFVDRSDPDRTRAAVEAGVSAYVVDGMQPARVAPILDAAISRFNMFARMQSELETTRRALEERKVIDRAKGLLMKARGVSEEEAYGLLRTAAMDQGKRLADVAQALITAAELLR